MESWRQNAGDNIKKAEVNWAFVKDQAEPVLVGPPCRADPPSVIVTTSDNKRRLIVGRQVAVDQTGQPIGKGDIGAQLRQVGKNLDACLKAVGASEDDLVFTRIYVSDKSLLANGADSQSRFLRPDGPSSTMIVGPNFAGPDFLIGVEGVANLN
jgi:enamine deaminase RidA (YjgF/YER057c/UK114 family)